MLALVRSAILLFAVGMSTVAAAADVIWYQDVNAAWAEAERTKRPVLFHFGAPWCGPCQKMEQVTLHQPRVQQLLRTSVIGVKVDGERNPQLLQKFNITTFPTDVMVEPNGRPLLVTTSFKTETEYLEFMMRGLSRWADLRSAPPPQPRPQLAQLMIEGYCPVTLSTRREWHKGQATIFSEHNGQRYQFVSEAAREQFRQDPDRYIPQFLGCDPVIVWNTNRAVPGNIEYGAYYDNLLYLFSSAENRALFKKSPDTYLTTKVVLSPDQIETVLR